VGKEDTPRQPRRATDAAQADRDAVRGGEPTARAEPTLAELGLSDAAIGPPPSLLEQLARLGDLPGDERRRIVTEALGALSPQAIEDRARELGTSLDVPRDQAEAELLQRCAELVIRRVYLDAELLRDAVADGDAAALRLLRLFGVSIAVGSGAGPLGRELAARLARWESEARVGSPNARRRASERLRALHGDRSKGPPRAAARTAPETLFADYVRSLFRTTRALKMLRHTKPAPSAVGVRALESLSALPAGTLRTWWDAVGRPLRSGVTVEQCARQLVATSLRTTDRQVANILSRYRGSCG
jgi:hypothetical protein